VLQGATFRLVDEHGNAVPGGGAQFVMRATTNDGNALPPNAPEVELPRPSAFGLSGEVHLTGPCRIKPQSGPQSADCTLWLHAQILPPANGWPHAVEQIALPGPLQVQFTNTMRLAAAERARVEERQRAAMRQQEEERLAREATKAARKAFDQQCKELAELRQSKADADKRVETCRIDLSNALRSTQILAPLLQPNNPLFALFQILMGTEPGKMTPVSAVVAGCTPGTPLEQMNQLTLDLERGMKEADIGCSVGFNMRESQAIQEVRGRARELNSEVLGAVSELFTVSSIKRHGQPAQKSHALAAVLSDYIGQSRLSRVVCTSDASAAALHRVAGNDEISVQPLDGVRQAGAPWPTSQQLVPPPPPGVFCKPACELLMPAPALSRQHADALRQKVWPNLVNGTLVMDTLQHAKDYRQQLIRSPGKVPTILCLDGKVLQSDNVYGGRQNSKRTRLEDCRGWHFGISADDQDVRWLSQIQAKLHDYSNREAEARDIVPKLGNLEQIVQHEHARLVAQFGEQLVRITTPEGVAAPAYEAPHTRKRSAGEAGLGQAGGDSRQRGAAAPAGAAPPPGPVEMVNRGRR